MADFRPMFQFGQEDEERRRQYEALGRFVQLFASTETLVQFTLWAASGVSNAVAKAIFAGVKTDQAIQYIKRIFQVRDVFADRRSSYEELFIRIGQISSARNLLLHHGISSEDDELVATNSWLALTARHARKIPVSVEVLSALAADTAKLNAHLQVNMILDKNVRDSIVASIEHLQRPWVYTPPT